MKNKMFGFQLLKERRKKGMTTLEVAEACGFSRSYITLIENGLRLPGKKNIFKIAVALKIKKEVALNWYLEDLAQTIKKKALGK